MSRLSVLDLRGSTADPRPLLPRPREAMGRAATAAAEVIEAVRTGGDAALHELTERFDGVRRDDLRVDPSRCAAAFDDLDADLRAALERAVDQVRWFHERARPTDWEDERDGARMGQWHRPVARAGVYVPGGKAAYPSTVIMTVVPALVAGVDQIVLCTPPTGEGGHPNATILAAAHLLGVTEVFAVGGAQAIAAMALGTESIPACDKVVGPGNMFVAAAKQQVQAAGLCGIDSLAGPTEIAIVADDTADPTFVATDLVAQAEHDEMAGVILVTTDPSLVDRVEAAIEVEVAATLHRQRVEDALAGQGTVVLVDDLDQAVEVAEAYAAEHLEVHTADADAVARRIRWAGTTFIGASTPVSLGDYAAGPNHTLPVLGTARFTGGLTTASFMVTVNHVTYDAESLAELAPTVETLARAENLPAHWRAVEARLDAAR
ncbi:MAG: histidinol dehydrogenase [Nitriliruptoraceae bacterium]